GACLARNLPKGDHFVCGLGSSRCACRIYMRNTANRDSPLSEFRLADNPRVSTVRAHLFDSFVVTGAPAAFQALKPPPIWATGVNPISWTVLVASAERQPAAQKKTYSLPDP